MPTKRFDQLPVADPLTGAELIPIMQRGGTVHTTANLLAATGPPWVDALTAGAVGNGTTDDTNALQAILDSHRIAYLRPGHNFVTRALTLRSGSGFVGENPGGYVQAGQVAVPATAVSKLTLAPSTNAAMLTMPGDESHVVLRDLELDGNDFYQTAALNLIDVPAAVGAAREVRLIIDNIWAHNSEGKVLFIGPKRVGVIITRAVLTNALQEVVAIWGNDVRIDQTLIGIGAADGLKIAGDVYSVTDTEVFSCDGAGLVLDARRGIPVVGSAIDRNGGRGVYIASGCLDATFVATTFHTNSVNANNAESHVDVRDGVSARFMGCTWAGNDSGITNTAKWCVAVDAAAVGVGFAFCTRYSGASVSSTPSLTDPAGLSSLAAKTQTLGQPQWPTGTSQTTVGAAGPAATLPATPTTYLRVVAPNGTTMVVPAYPAS